MFLEDVMYASLINWPCLVFIHLVAKQLEGEVNIGRKRFKIYLLSCDPADIFHFIAYYHDYQST